MHSGPDCPNPAFACSIWRDLLFYGIHCFINPCVVFPFVILYPDDSQANWNPEQRGWLWLSVGILLTTSRIPRARSLYTEVSLGHVPGRGAITGAAMLAFSALSDAWEKWAVWNMATENRNRWRLKGHNNFITMYKWELSNQSGVYVEHRDCVCCNISSNFVMNTLARQTWAMSGRPPKPDQVLERNWRRWVLTCSCTN